MLSYLILNITDSELIERINTYSIENISDEDLDDKGREIDYHMTLLSNITTDSELPLSILNGKSITVKLGKVSRFENDDYDVIKIEVEKSEQLMNLYNKLVSEVDNEIEYDFNPHITIAYIKKGACKELDNDTEFEGTKNKFELVKFSPEDKTEVVYRKLAKVFHKDIGFPKGFYEKLMWFVAELNGLPTRYTTHFYENNEYTNQVKNFFKYIQLKVSNIFEVTTDDKQNIIKIACRVEYGDGRDICFSVNQNKAIITFWFNNAFDYHDTLDKRKYDYAMKKKSGKLGYGGWLSPQGEYNEVQFEGHLFWIAQNRKDLYLNEDGDPQTDLINEGWIRITLGDILAFRIKDFSRLRMIDGFIFDNNLTQYKDDIFIDCEKPEKTFRLTYQEYKENDFSLKSAISHSRDIRGMKKKSYKWEKDVDNKFETLIIGDYKFEVVPDYVESRTSKRKLGGWSIFVEYMNIHEEFKSGFKTPYQAKKYVLDKYINVKKSSKSTSLKLISYTDLARVEKLLDSLNYHSYNYRMDGDSIVFDDIDELQDVKTLLDSYGIGNLIKTSKTEDDIQVDYWDFDGRESYSFVMNDDGKEVASLQTETYDEGRHGIFDIEVNKNNRRKGLGTKLFYYAKDYLNNLGIELIHSNNLSEDGKNWKNSLAGTYINWTDLKALKDYLTQYLGGKTTGANIHEIDFIYDYKELINWLYKNAKKEVGLISKLNSKRFVYLNKNNDVMKNIKAIKNKLSNEHLEEDAERFKKIDDEADDIKDEIDELQKDDELVKNSGRWEDSLDEEEDADEYDDYHNINFDEDINSNEEYDTRFTEEESLRDWFGNDDWNKASMKKKSDRWREGDFSLFDSESAKEVCDRIKSEIDLPIVKTSISTLGGNDQVSISILLGFEELTSYLENSKYSRFSLDRKGVLEMFTASSGVRGQKPIKFRKTKLKTVDQLIQKLNDYINQVKSEPIINSAIKKVADSSVEGKAWLEGYMDRFTVVSDEQVKAILNSDMSREMKEIKIEERIEQMLNDMPTDDMQLMDFGERFYNIDSEDIQWILDDDEEDRMNRMNKKADRIDKDEFKFVFENISSDKYKNILEGLSVHLPKTLRTDYFDSPNDGKIIYIYNGNIHIGTYVSGTQTFYSDISIKNIGVGNKKTFMKKKAISFEKGFGYWDVTKYPYGGDFKRFKGNEEGEEDTKGEVKNANQIRVKLNDGRTIITDRDAIINNKTNMKKKAVNFRVIFEEWEDTDNIHSDGNSFQEWLRQNYPAQETDNFIWNEFDYRYADDIYDDWKENAPTESDYRKSDEYEPERGMFNQGNKTNMKKKAKMEFPNSRNSIIRNVTVFEGGGHSEIVNNYNYEEDLTDDGIPLQWDYKTLPQEIMDYAFDSGAMDDLGDDYDFGGMDIGFIGHGTTTVNMFRYDENLKLKNVRKIETSGEDYDDIETTNMKKISTIDHLGHEDVYDLEPELLISLEDITEDEEESYPENSEHWNMINTNQSKEVIEAQLTEQINIDYPRDLTYESIFQCAMNTGLVDNMDRYNIIGILNSVAINFGLPRTSWDDFFPKSDIISEIDLHGTDSSITFDEDGEFSPESIINNYDNDADSLFTIDRILDERLKHFINTDELISESSIVVKSAMNNLKRKQAYIKKYRLGDIKIGDTDMAGRILNGNITYSILLRSIKNRDVEKTIDITLPIRARKVEMPNSFKYKQEEFPLQNYYITDILES